MPEKGPCVSLFCEAQSYFSSVCRHWLSVHSCNPPINPRKGIFIILQQRKLRSREDMGLKKLTPLKQAPQSWDSGFFFTSLSTQRIFCQSLYGGAGLSESTAGGNRWELRPCGQRRLKSTLLCKVRRRLQWKLWDRLSRQREQLVLQREKLNSDLCDWSRVSQGDNGLRWCWGMGGASLSAWVRLFTLLNKQT